jgi:hypothetical protein
MRVVAVPTRYECEKCGESFTNAFRAESHEDEHLAEKGVCPDCRGSGDSGIECGSGCHTYACSRCGGTGRVSSVVGAEKKQTAEQPPAPPVSLPEKVMPGDWLIGPDGLRVVDGRDR